MTTSVAVFPPGFRVTDANDLPMSGAVIEFYAAGTTTPKTVYSDSDLTVPIGTSVTCDSGGYPSSGGNRVLVYVNENAYKIIGKDADGNTLWEHDEVLGAITPGSGSGGSGSAADTFGFQVGMVALTLTASPASGWIRLTESAQSLLKADYPDLNTWASEQGYPWGSSSTTFNIPPAGGYFLRFGSSDGSIDPGGPRSPGSTQLDAFQGHYHTLTNTSSPFGQVNGASPGVGTSGTLGNFGSTTPAVTTPTTDGTNGTPRTATETRAKNVAMYADMLAVPALVSSGLVGAVGPVWKWNSSTSASDVSSGRLALNNATIDSATTFYVSETSDNGSALASFLQSIPSGSKVWITKVGTPATWLAFTVSSTATDAGSYDSFSITSVSHGGTLSNGDDVSVVFMPAGTTGSNGSNGANGTDPGIRWLFASSTTMADPSAGNIRLNNATLSSVTEISVHYSSGETGNPSVSNWVKGWDDSTSTTVLGTLVIKKASAPQNFIVLHVNAALTDNTTWAQIPVTYVDSAGSFSASDVLSVQFFRAGNKGTDGAGAGDVSAASNFGTDNRILRSDGTTKGAQSSAVTLDDNGNLSGVGTVVTSGAVTVGTTSATAPKIDPSGFIEYPEISAPATPSSGFIRVYAKSDNKLYQKDDGGTETDLSAAGGGSSSAAIIPQNVGLAVSASASALTISLKGSDGNDPSGSNIVYLPFRSATGTTGTETTVQVTAATSLTISSGSTLGVTSSTAFRIWVVAFNDAGTIRLGAVNCVTWTSSKPSAILSLTDNTLASSTAEGGAGAADSSGVIYTGTAVSSKAYRILGYVEWNTSGVTAGTWTTTNLSLVQLWAPGMPTPGAFTGNSAEVLKTDTFTSAVATAFTDITGFNVSITPTSASNLVDVSGVWHNTATGGNVAATRMVRGSTAISVGDASGSRNQATSTIFRTTDNISVNCNAFQTIDNPQATTATTYKVQYWSQGGTYLFNLSIDDYTNGTGTSNDANHPRLASVLTVREVMG